MRSRCLTCIKTNENSCKCCLAVSKTMRSGKLEDEVQSGTKQMVNAVNIQNMVNAVNIQNMVNVIN